MRIHAVTAGLLAVALLLLGCGEEESPGPAASSGTRSEGLPGDEGLATWEVSSPEAVGPEDDSLEIGVSRVGCANGETGEIVGLDVDPGEDRVVIEATVEAFEGEAACPANEVVPAVVELDEPLSDRKLVDGACAHERAAGTRWCETAVRWSPGADEPESSRTAP